MLRSMKAASVVVATGRRLAATATARPPASASKLATTAPARRTLATASEAEEEREFDRRADELLEELESALEAAHGPLDPEEFGVAMGVLTLSLGKRGTWVINKQRPNRQVWWSSPLSGPKRFAFERGAWRNTRDANVTLVELLSEELSKVAPGMPNLQSLMPTNKR